MYYEAFPKKLQKARKETGLSLREVGKELKIPHSTISNWEQGRTQPDIETIGTLADFYGVSVDWLFGTGFAKKKET